VRRFLRQAKLELAQRNGDVGVLVSADNQAASAIDRRCGRRMQGSGIMISRSMVFGAAVAAVALTGCEQIGMWTGRYEPRQPQVASGPQVASAPQAASVLTRLGATLSGASEVPMNFSNATGTAQVGFDRRTGLLSWIVSYENLTGEVAAAHFHGPAAEGENAGVQVNIGEAGLASPIQGAVQITPEQAAALLGGLWYINIHSSAFPDGEIRGQVGPGM
jgi:hypothetical protein